MIKATAQKEQAIQKSIQKNYTQSYTITKLTRAMNQVGNHPTMTWLNDQRVQNREPDKRQRYVVNTES